MFHSEGAKVTGGKKILLLGSGFVSAPLVDYLLREKSNSVTIGNESLSFSLKKSEYNFLAASNSVLEANKLSRGRMNAPVLPLDVKDSSGMQKLVGSHDVVVSFVPASFHTAVAECCIEAKKHLVTASYISPAMKALDSR